MCGSPVSSPTLVEGLDSIVALTSGMDHTCALRSDGSLFCWGLNQYAQLGIGAIEGHIPFDSCSPVLVPDLAAVTSVSGEGLATCALASCKDVWCWGGNVVSSWEYDGLDVGGSTPVFIATVQGARAVSGTCLVTATHTVSCWERTPVLDEDALFAGATPWDAAVPIVVPELNDVDSITAFGRYVLKTDGTVWCWHCADTPDLVVPGAQEPPWQVPGLYDVTFVAGSGVHTCALTQDGRILCWGENEDGQLGNGTTESMQGPAEVKFDE